MSKLALCTIVPGYEKCSANGKAARCGNCQELIFIAETVPGNIQFKPTQFCPQCGAEIEKPAAKLPKEEIHIGFQG